MGLGSSFSRTALLAVLFTACPHPGAAADRENQRDAIAQCNDRAGKYTPHQRINGCTLVIKYMYGGGRNVGAAFYGRGLAYLDLEQPKNALNDLNRAIDWANKSHQSNEFLSTLQWTIGLAHTLANQDAEAISAFSKSIALDPKFAEAYSSRCWSRLQLNIDLDLALEDCSAAIAIGPLSRFFDNRSSVHYKLGHWQDAWNDADKAYAMKPQASALYARGLAALKLGRKQAGEADLAEAAKMDPGVVKSYADSGMRP